MPKVIFYSRDWVRPRPGNKGKKRRMAKKIRLDQGQIEVVDDLMAHILRAKTAAERIRIGFELWASTRNLLLVHLRKTHPDWNAEKIKREVSRRLSHGAI